MTENDSQPASKEVLEEKLRNRIISLVAQIKSKRNRPCYDSIHHHLHRDVQYKGMEKNDLCPFIDTMVSDGYLVNIGTGTNESFKVVEKEAPVVSFEGPPNERPTSKLPSVAEVGEPTTNEKEDSTADGNLDQRFGSFMFEVMKAVDHKITELFKNFSSNTNPCEASGTSQDRSADPHPNQSLQDEIDSLREQLREKDAMILKLQQSC